MSKAAFTNTGTAFTHFPKHFYNSCHTKGIFMGKGLLAHGDVRKLIAGAGEGVSFYPPSLAFLTRPGGQT